MDQELKERRLDARIVLQVHDELLVEVRAEEAETVAALLTEKMKQPPFPKRAATFSAA